MLFSQPFSVLSIISALAIGPAMAQRRVCSGGDRPDSFALEVASGEYKGTRLQTNNGAIVFGVFGEISCYSFIDGGLVTNFPFDNVTRLNYGFNQEISNVYDDGYWGDRNSNFRTLVCQAEQRAGSSYAGAFNCGRDSSGRSLADWTFASCSSPSPDVLRIVKKPSGPWSGNCKPLTLIAVP